MPVCAGLAQGDPLSALLFSAAIACTLRILRLDAPDTAAFAYVDDIVLVASRQHMLPAFRRLQALLANLHLQVQPQKTLLWHCPADAPFARAISAAIGCQSTAEGLLVCGMPLQVSEDTEIPLGDETYVGTFLAAKLRNIDERLTHLISLCEFFPQQEGPQVIMTILRSAYPGLIMHLLRSCRFSDIKPWTELLLDEMMRQHVSATLHLPPLSASQWAIASLPPLYGGAGLADLSALAPAARASSLAQMPMHNPLLAPVVRDLYEHDAEELHARITALTRCPAATLLRPHADAHHPRSPKAVLKRILTHYHQTKVQELDAAFSTDEQGWSYRWRSAIGTLHHLKPQPSKACMQWISATPMLATLAMPALVLRLAKAAWCARS